ncbi:MAG: hypothetical protein QOJ40_563 [Verrucomicrobiota bacterium]
MKRWALIVLALYLLIMAALTLPLVELATFPSPKFSEAVQIYGYGAYWCWVGVMLLVQLLLLTVPVRIAERRPVTRRSLWLPVLTSGLMMGALILGAAFALLEFGFREHTPAWLQYGAMALAVLLWCIWTVVFFRLSRNADPAGVISRQCRLLLKGSILELLIAVPTHLVARHRTYCCAGFMTFLGLTLGISVMLFSFGPAVFFLYVDRWRRLHPQAEPHFE